MTFWSNESVSDEACTSSFNRFIGFLSRTQKKKRRGPVTISDKFNNIAGTRFIVPQANISVGEPV